MITFIVAVFALTMLHAYFDSWQFSKWKTVNHFSEFAIYLSLAIALCVVIDWSERIGIKWLAWCIATTLLTRVAFYDFALNIFRKGFKGVFYISPNALDGYSGTKESWWDSKVKKHANWVRLASLVAYLIWIIYFLISS